MNYLLIIFTFIVLASCERPQPNEVKKPEHSLVKISNKIDPICRMDVQKEYSDTLLYKGKVIGFCSIVCKERFIEKVNDNTLNNDY